MHYRSSKDLCACTHRCMRAHTKTISGVQLTRSYAGMQRKKIVQTLNNNLTFCPTATNDEALCITFNLFHAHSVQTAGD